MSAEEYLTFIWKLKDTTLITLFIALLVVVSFMLSCLSIALCCHPTRVNGAANDLEKQQSTAKLEAIHRSPTSQDTFTYTDDLQSTVMPGTTEVAYAIRRMVLLRITPHGIVHVDMLLAYEQHRHSPLVPTHTSRGMEESLSLAPTLHSIAYNDEPPFYEELAVFGAIAEHSA